MKRIIKYLPKPIRERWLKKYTQKYRQSLQGKTVAEVFDHIYEKRIWGKAGNESGSGSTKARTAVIRTSLEQLIQQYNIQSLLEKINRSLQNIRQSDIKYLSLTTFPETTENQDILTGEWRRLNMELSPFNLKAIEIIHEKLPEYNGVMSDKSLMLVEISKE